MERNEIPKISPNTYSKYFNIFNAKLIPNKLNSENEISYFDVVLFPNLSEKTKTIIKSILLILLTLGVSNLYSYIKINYIKPFTEMIFGQEKKNKEYEDKITELNSIIKEKSEDLIKMKEEMKNEMENYFNEKISKKQNNSLQTETIDELKKEIKETQSLIKVLSVQKTITSNNSEKNNNEDLYDLKIELSNIKGLLQGQSKTYQKRYYSEEEEEERKDRRRRRKKRDPYDTDRSDQSREEEKEIEKKKKKIQENIEKNKKTSIKKEEEEEEDDKFFDNIYQQNIINQNKIKESINKTSYPNFEITNKQESKSENENIQFEEVEEVEGTTGNEIIYENENKYENEKNEKGNIKYVREEELEENESMNENIKKNLNQMEPKMKKSKLFGFMTKLSSGEIKINENSDNIKIFENNKTKETNETIENEKKINTETKNINIEINKNESTKQNEVSETYDEMKYFIKFKEYDFESDERYQRMLELTEQNSTFKDINVDTLEIAYMRLKAKFFKKYIESNFDFDKYSKIFPNKKISENEIINDLKNENNELKNENNEIKELKNENKNEEGEIKNEELKNKNNEENGETILKNEEELKNENNEKIENNPFSENYIDVIKKLQKGESLDGIKVVDDKPKKKDASITPSKKNKKLKPWEKKNFQTNESIESNLDNVELE
jgi:hypothetical protein